jgi:hypothetical protein
MPSSGDGAKLVRFHSAPGDVFMSINLLRDRANVHPVDTDEPHVGVVALDAVRTKLQTIDRDLHKGAVEDEQASIDTNAPGLDQNGLPNDRTLIAQDAIGARADGSQG